MHPAQQISLSDHLQVVHDGVVASLRSLLRVAPDGGRMGASGENGEAVLSRHLGRSPAQFTELAPRVLHAHMGRCHHLDLWLQEFRRDAPVGSSLGGIEERGWHVVDDQLRLGIDQEIFFLDADCEGPGHPLTRSVRRCGLGEVH